MPNWCKGTLKARGAVEDIKKWIENEINCYDFFGMEKEERPKVKIDDYEIYAEIPSGGHVSFSRRNFISGSSYYCFDDDPGLAILCFDIEAAWSFDAEPYVKHSKEYNLDFRIHGFEKGMEFEQILEVINGEVTIDKEINHEDYMWEAYDPRLGG